jgi:hypothetical protein
MTRTKDLRIRSATREAEVTQRRKRTRSADTQRGRDADGGPLPMGYDAAASAVTEGALVRRLQLVNASTKITLAEGEKKVQSLKLGGGGPTGVR